MAPLPDSAVTHLQSAIRCRTISYSDSSQWDPAPFLAMRQLLEASYPLVHRRLQREIVSDFSYLYRWEGKNPGLAPYILMAHQDVVPIEEASRKLWTAEPFSGALTDGVIYGRGAIDDKCNLISIFESAERLLAQGFQPERTIYFALGQDEEIGGHKGARAIAKLLKSRHIRADLILDEGGIITAEKVPGTSRPVALLGTAEKGFMNLTFTVQKTGGHSSMPDRETAIDILMKALVRLHEHPFPARFEQTTQGFIEYLGPELSFPANMAFNNQWLFKSMIVKNLERTPAGSAMLHTTGVTTILESGVKENVIPTVAMAKANFRMLPGDSSRQVIQAVKNIIADDRVSIALDERTLTEGQSSPQADGPGFQKIRQIVQQTYASLLVAPFLMIGGTDSAHFSEISDNIVKFSPVVDPIGFHTHNEQVSVDNFQHSIWFYEQLMRSAR